MKTLYLRPISCILPTVFCLLALSCHTISAQTDGSWIISGSGNWGTASNWSSDPLIPGGVGSEVSVNAALSSAATITLDGDSRTVGILNIGREAAGGIRAYTVAAQNGEVLRFDNGGDAAQLNFSEFSVGDNIFLPIDLYSSLEIRNQSDGFKTIGGASAPISSATAGLKTISNLGDGSWRVWLRKIEDGAGVVSVVQNSATSPLVLGLSGQDNTYSGGTTLEQGVIFASVPTAFGTGVITLNGGTINNSSSSSTMSLANDVVANADIRFLDDTSGSGNFQFAQANQTVTMTTDVEFFVGKSQVTFTGGSEISDGGNGYSLTKTGEGILFLSTNGITTHTGGTIVKEGTLTVAGIGNHLVDTAPVTVDGGTLNIATNATVGAVTLIGGTITGSGTNTFTGSSYDLRAGTVSRALGGAGSEVTKTSDGEVVLSAANTYTGATAVNAGVLTVTDTGSIHNSSTITVAGGAELNYNSSTARTGAIVLAGSAGQRAVLSGDGQFNFALSLDSVDDALSPGNSPGILSFGVSQSWDSFTYVWEVNDFEGTTAGDSFDQITIAGGLALTGGTGAYVLDIVSLDALDVVGDVPNFSEIARDWVVLSTSGGITGFDEAAWTLDSSSFTSDPAWAGSWSLAQVGDDLVLTYTPIPEPATTVALIAAVALLVALRRRGKGTAA